MKKVIIYTTIGLALIVLGVYTTPSDVYAEDSIVSIQYPLVLNLTNEQDIDESNLEEVQARRVV